MSEYQGQSSHNLPRRAALWVELGLWVRLAVLSPRYSLDRKLQLIENVVEPRPIVDVLHNQLAILRTILRLGRDVQEPIHADKTAALDGEGVVSPLQHRIQGSYIVFVGHLVSTVERAQIQRIDYKLISAHLHQCFEHDLNSNLRGQELDKLQTDDRPSEKENPVHMNIANGEEYIVNIYDKQVYDYNNQKQRGIVVLEVETPYRANLESVIGESSRVASLAKLFQSQLPHRFYLFQLGGAGDLPPGEKRRDDACIPEDIDEAERKE